MFAAHFDNFLFLLLVVVAVLFQLLAKMAGKKNKDQTKQTSTPIPKTPAPLQRAPTESGEDLKRIGAYSNGLARVIVPVIRALYRGPQGPDTSV